MTAAVGRARDEAAYLMQTIGIGGADVVADRAGALYWPAERALVVADLHLEKGSSFARRHVFLPPYDSRETLARLADVIARMAPSVVIALGDSFHDADGALRLGAEEREALAALQTGRTWIWVNGNHDGGADVLPGGERCDQLVLGGVTLRHEPDADSEGAEIAGHLHPAARVALAGASMRRACFIACADRLVLPAFGALTGGLNVLSAPFVPLFGDDFSVWVLGGRGVYPAARRALRPD